MVAWVMRLSCQEARAPIAPGGSCRPQPQPAGISPRSALPIEETAGEVGAASGRASTARPLVDQLGAQHAGQQPARERRGEQHAVALDEQRGEAAFGQEAVGVDEHHLERGRPRARVVVEGAIAGLVARAGSRAARPAAARSRPPPARRARRQRRDLDRDRAASARAAAARGAGSRSRKVAACSSLRARMAVEGEAERSRARLHPREMAFEQRRCPSLGIEAPSSRSGRTGAAPAVTNAPLARHSAHSSSARRIGDDARAQPQRRAIVAAADRPACGSRR